MSTLGGQYIHWARSNIKQTTNLLSNNMNLDPHSSKRGVMSTDIWHWYWRRRRAWILNISFQRHIILTSSIFHKSASLWILKAQLPMPWEICPLALYRTVMYVFAISTQIKVFSLLGHHAYITCNQSGFRLDSSIYCFQAFARTVLHTEPNGIIIHATLQISKQRSACF